jgi:hypothetical protein
VNQMISKRFCNQTSNAVMFALASGTNTVHAIYVYDVVGAGVFIEGQFEGNVVQASTFINVGNGVYLWNTGHNTIQCKACIG